MEEKVKEILNKLSEEELKIIQNDMIFDEVSFQSRLASLIDEKHKQKEETKKKYEEYFKEREEYQKYIHDSLRCKHPNEELLSVISSIWPGEFMIDWMANEYYKAWYYKHNNSCIIPCDRKKLMKYLQSDIKNVEWNLNDRLLDNNRLIKYLNKMNEYLKSMPRLNNEKYPNDTDPIDGKDFAERMFYDAPSECIKNNSPHGFWSFNILYRIVYRALIYKETEEIVKPEYPMPPREMFINDSDLIKNHKWKYE